MIVWQQKKSQLLQEVNAAQRAKIGVQKSVAWRRQFLQETNERLADQRAHKDNLLKLTKLCHKQWQLNLEVRSNSKSIL